MLPQHALLMSGVQSASLGGLVVALMGCVFNAPDNPSFPLTSAAASDALAEMRTAPRTLERPVIVVGGYMDPGFGTRSLVRRLRRLTGDDRVYGISFGWVWTFEACREKVIDRLQHILPSGDPEWTTEVDVVGISMGGVISRYAASRIDRGPEPVVARRLRIARLFTISTPHRGAIIADTLPGWNRLHIDLRSNSPFLRGLNTLPKPRYAIYPYVRLGDLVVGERNSIPPYDDGVWWVPTPCLGAGHMGAVFDLRIIADIARRLRGETPFSRRPRSPLPGTTCDPIVMCCTGSAIEESSGAAEVRITPWP